MNLISPWLVEGERLGDVLASMSKERGLTPDQLRAEMTEGTAFKRTVSARQTSSTLVLFLCSPAANNLTGQDINVAAGAVMY